MRTLKDRKISHCFRVALAMLLALLLCAGCAAPAAAPTGTPTPSSKSPAASASAAPSKAPSASPTPSVTPEPEPSLPPQPSPSQIPEIKDPVKEIIDSMSDQELLGQMIMIGGTGTSDIPKETKELIGEYKIGSFMLFGWNAITFPQTKKLIANINKVNSSSNLPLFIGLDVEGGKVHRLNWKPWLSSASTLGKANDPKRVYDEFLKIGKGLRDIGVNLDLAPVLDIAPKLSGTFLGPRMFGTDPDKVIPLTDMAVKGLQDGGVLSMGKHFPGHGATATDSHVSLPIIKTPKDELMDYTLKPFQAASDKGIDAMLVAHLLVPALDPQYPASISKKIITDLLREKMGFKGIIFSDDMRMGAITRNYEIGEACVRFIEAGGDVVLIGKYYKKQVEALAALENALQTGRLKRERLEESAYRIISAKLRLIAQDRG